MPPRAKLVALLVALSLLATGCANTLEGVGGATTAAGAGVFLFGAAFPATRHCSNARPCYENGAPVQGVDVTTYFERNVPLMITGGVLAATGITLYVIGRLNRPTTTAPPPPPPPPAPLPEDDPESTILRQ